MYVSVLVTYQTLMPFYPCYHHGVHGNAFQMCLWSPPPFSTQYILRVLLTVCVSWSSLAQICAVYICWLLVWISYIKPSCRVDIIVCLCPPTPRARVPAIGGGPPSSSIPLYKTYHKRPCGLCVTGMLQNYALRALCSSSAQQCS